MNHYKLIVASALLSLVGCAEGAERTGSAATGAIGGSAGIAGTGIAGAGVAGEGGSGGTGVAGTGFAGEGGSGGTGVAGTGVAGTGVAGTGVAGEGGSGGTGVDGGVAGESGSGGTGGSPVLPKCLEKESQVIVIGDSYINWVSHTMPDDLKVVSNQTWRMYAIGAASMASGGASFIPDQFERAILEDSDITTVVMTGGGNDILVPNAFFFGGGECKNRMDAPSLPVCQMIVDLAIDKAIEVMDRAVEVGVKDVIYFFYPEVPEGTLIGGLHPRAILNYALPLVRETCTGAEARTGGKLKCHFIDTIPIFRGHDDWFADADIHENSLGSMAISEEIWRVMQDSCIAQKPGNACCTP